MTRRRPAHRQQRQPVYVGCEGASEAAYVALLQDFITAADLPFHLKIDNLGSGAGDPLSRIELAAMRIGRQTNSRGAPVARFILLDTDQLSLNKERGEKAKRLATQHDITIVWQDPCFEALLLRHLPERTMHRPPDSQRAYDALAREWAEYGKPMSRTQLAKRINRDALIRAAAVEPTLHILLRAVALI